MARWFSILHQRPGEMPRYYSWFSREKPFRRFVQALIRRDLELVLHSLEQQAAPDAGAE